MKAFLEYVARSLVDNPDAVEVEIEEDGDEVTLTLIVDEADMGRVIGKRGRTAQAIRAVTRAAAVKDGVEVNIEFME